MAEKQKKRRLGVQILYWLREREPMKFEELTPLYCKWRYGTLRPGKRGIRWKTSAQAIKTSVTYLALNGLVKVTADVPPFDGLRILLTDKGKQYPGDIKEKGERDET